MSRRNPSSRSASSPKVEEKTLLFFSTCSMPRKGLYRSSRHLKPVSLAKDSHQVLKPKKMALGIPLTSLNAMSSITHSAIASQDSSRVTTTFNAHCTAHCTTTRKISTSILRITTQSRYDTVPYCSHDITCRGNLLDHGTATGTGVQCACEGIVSCDYKK